MSEIVPRKPASQPNDDPGPAAMHLRGCPAHPSAAGIALSMRAKIDFFEEMVSFVVRFGARDRLASRRADEADVASPPVTTGAP